jgi:hypothetical protein
MKPLALPPWAALAALLLLVPVTRATTVIPPDFDSLVGTADYVVRAVVKSVRAEWRPDPTKPGQHYIGTLVALDVKEVIKGAPPQPLVLDLVGGSLEGREMVIVDSPRFVVGQESILFVHGNGRNIIPLVGLSHGYYPVRRDKRTGRDEVLRSNGQPLYDQKEVSLPESALRSAATPAQALPLTPAEFALRIRKSPKFTSDRARLE